jgi:hypothetical protein
MTSFASLSTSCSSQRRQGAFGNSKCIRCNSNCQWSRFLDPDLLGTTVKLAGGAGRLLLLLEGALFIVLVLKDFSSQRVVAIDISSRVSTSSFESSPDTYVEGDGNVFYNDKVLACRRLSKALILRFIIAVRHYYVISFQMMVI